MALELDKFTTSASIRDNLSESSSARSTQVRVSVSERPLIYASARDQSAAPRLLSEIARSQSQYSSSLESANVQPCHIIEKYEDHDDAGHIKVWRERLHKLLPVTTLASIVAYGLYFAYRIICTVNLQRVDQTIYPVAWVFITIELGVICESQSLHVRLRQLLCY